MPFIHVHTSRGVETAVRRALGVALARAYGEHMQTTHRIVNVAFSFYEAGDIARYDADEDAAAEMTVVTCEIRSGRTVSAIESLGRAFTELCAQHLTVDPLRIAVYMNEYPASHIYRDGGTAPAWSSDERGLPSPA